MLDGQQSAEMEKSEEALDRMREPTQASGKTDVYFSADVETDGPVPGPYSILSFALVYAGTFDGKTFVRPNAYKDVFYTELRPISGNFQKEALDVNKLDRGRLIIEGIDPEEAMNNAYDWIMERTIGGEPVLVAYPLSFDWTWLFWYFSVFCKRGSPFNYSRCYDVKTALAVKARIPVSSAGRSKMPTFLTSLRPHTHNAIDDAIEQADIFGNLFEWQGSK